MPDVRPAQRGDADAVAAVHVRSWQAGYRGLLPDDYLEGLRAEDRRDHYTFGAIDPEMPSTAVAVDGGVICGFVTTGPSRDTVVGVGEVLALYVDPGVWGLGVGRRLMAHAREQLSRAGFTEAILWVLSGNERAQRFYRADGWEPDGDERTVVVWNVVVDEVRFRRRLP